MLRTIEPTDAVPVHVAQGATALDRFEALAIGFSAHETKGAAFDVQVYLGASELLEHMAIIGGALLMPAAAHLRGEALFAWLGCIGTPCLRLRDVAQRTPIFGVSVVVTLPSARVADIGTTLCGVASVFRAQIAAADAGELA